MTNKVANVYTHLVDVLVNPQVVQKDHHTLIKNSFNESERNVFDKHLDVLL